MISYAPSVAMCPEQSARGFGSMEVAPLASCLSAVEQMPQQQYRYMQEETQIKKLIPQSVATFPIKSPMIQIIDLLSPLGYGSDHTGHSLVSSCD